MNRRNFLIGLAGAGVAVAAQGQGTRPPTAPPPQRKGRLKQSLMRVNFGADTKLTFDDMCREAARMGFKGFDLIAPEDWPTLKKYGLTPSMAGAGPVTFQDGLIRKEVHARIEQPLRDAIDVCAAGGCPNIITVGGQRRGMPDAEAADNAVAFLNRIKAHAEDKGITISLENMNNMYTDPNFGREDQIFAHLKWGFDVVKRVSSPRVKVLFDIYHAQIMDGNVVATIRENFSWISHFHTAGVPGRTDIDLTQEVNYRYIAQTIADLGYTGFICHEFRPAPGHNPLDCIREAFAIIDV
jgi:hydroxypyruvate isomerase